MVYGLETIYLYAAKKIEIIASDNLNKKSFRGTCFFVSNGEKQIFLITNRHLIDIARLDLPDGYKIESIILSANRYNPRTDMYDIYESSEIVNWRDFNYHVNPNNDIACLLNPLVQGTMNVGNAVGISFLATNEEFNNSLSLCDRICYPNYSDWCNKINDDIETPIMRSGTIASDPKFKYFNKDSKQYGETLGDIISYEGFSSGGASGSPVFAIPRGIKLDSNMFSNAEGLFRRGMLIGINAGHYIGKQGHSGISYFCKSSAIIELINSVSCN